MSGDRTLREMRRDPRVRRIGRARDVSFAVIGLLAVLVGVYAVATGREQWWIPLGAGVVLLVAVAVGWRLHDPPE